MFSMRLCAGQVYHTSPTFGISPQSCSPSSLPSSCLNIVWTAIITYFISGTYAIDSFANHRPDSAVDLEQVTRQFFD